MDQTVRLLKAALAEHLAWPGARLSFLAQFLLALFKVHSVNLAEVAEGFSGPAQVASHDKHLPRFFRGFSVDDGPWAQPPLKPSWRIAGSSATRPRRIA